MRRNRPGQELQEQVPRAVLRGQEAELLEGVPEGLAHPEEGREEAHREQAREEVREGEGEQAPLLLRPCVVDDPW